MTSFETNGASVDSALGQSLSQLSAKGASFAEKLSASLGFTSIDQAFILWGVVSMVIFAIAQFSTIGWMTQAVIDAALTGACIACTSGLTWQVATIANLRWVVFLWAALMTVGMVLTTYGIFCGVASILINLCALWLGLCTLAYSVMGIKMRSYSFTGAALVHGAGIASLSQFPAWQFLVSGLVMALPLFFFSVVPWDMHVEADEPV